MQWIDEMFASVETDRAEASAKRSASVATVDPAELPEKRIPGAPDAWKALVSSIKNDVNDFNQHQNRAGQTAVRISQRNFLCEVHVPGMHGKRLVLTLDNNDLHVSAHPDFPMQQLSISIEPGQEGQLGLWVLGEANKESKMQSTQQLSEDLLKPFLSSAAINREG